MDRIANILWSSRVLFEKCWSEKAQVNKGDALVRIDRRWPSSEELLTSRIGGTLFERRMTLTRMTEGISFKPKQASKP